MAHEFNMQDKHISLELMPLYTLCSSTVDIIVGQKSALKQSLEMTIFNHLQNDTVLFRGEGRVKEEQDRQLDWLVEYANK